MEVFVGQKDNYEVKGFFASGGMGDIFEALDSHGNEVLIKVPKDLIKRGIVEKSKGSDGALYR